MIQKNCDVNLHNSWNVLENLPIPEIKALCSNPCGRQTTWPKWMKFWHKKRQCILFKTRLISNTWLLASVSKSLTESDNSAGWPGTCCLLPIFSACLPIFSRLDREAKVSYLHFLHESQMIIVGRHPQHNSVLDVQHDFLLFSVISNERMECIAIRNPAD